MQTQPRSQGFLSKQEREPWERGKGHTHWKKPRNWVFRRCSGIILSNNNNNNFISIRAYTETVLQVKYNYNLTEKNDNKNSQ